MCSVFKSITRVNQLCNNAQLGDQRAANQRRWGPTAWAVYGVARHDMEYDLDARPFGPPQSTAWGLTFLIHFSAPDTLIDPLFLPHIMPRQLIVNERR